MKAYKNPAGEVRTFRPNKHIERLNKSAARMAMPEFPKDLFLQALRELLALDAAWVPNKNIDDALYIRPLMFAADPFLGLRPSDKFLFCIFCSPASSYYAKPIKVMLSNQYVRAFPGGVGHAKAAGNYAATMLPLKEAQSKGFDQLLWMDGVEFKFAQEIGTMNIFFMMDDRVVTPVLDGTILDGVTRRSVIELLNDRGYYVQERRIGMDEVLNAHQHGKLQDVFGTGTAATLAHISDMMYGADTINLPNVEDRLLSGSIKKQLAEIKAGLADDIHGWMV
jgi:branched-chain amino acid aminotransferase